MTSQSPVLPAIDELFDRAVARTLGLGEWLDEAAFSALVDYVRSQLRAAAYVQRDAQS